jgi:hypothetical protein
MFETLTLQPLDMEECFFSKIFREYYIFNTNEEVEESDEPKYTNDNDFFFHVNQVNHRFVNYLRGITIAIKMPLDSIDEPIVRHVLD